jgi:hypothetical protein
MIDIISTVMMFECFAIGDSVGNGQQEVYHLAE